MFKITEIYSEFPNGYKNNFQFLVLNFSKSSTYGPQILEVLGPYKGGPFNMILRVVLYLIWNFQFQDQLKAQKGIGLVLIGTIPIVENMMAVTKEKNIFLQKLKLRDLLFELQKSHRVNFYLTICTWVSRFYRLKMNTL